MTKTIEEMDIDELRIEYLKTKEVVKRLETKLEEISTADTENYFEIENELDSEVGYLKDIAIEIAERVCNLGLNSE